MTAAATAAAERDLTVPARDGYALAATLHGASDDRPERLVLLAPATAVSRRYYARYARFLASRGLEVLTLDYRGTGGSRPPSLKGFPATMRDWAELDLAGAIDWAERERRPRRLLVVGHSIGGLLAVLAPNRDAVRAMVTVGSQSAYVGHYPLPWRWLNPLFFRAVLPLSTRAAGYFPARAIRFAGEDLPAGVALEWARWCMRPEYVGEPARFASWKAPVRAYGFEDDAYAPRRTVEAMLEWFTGAPKEHRHVVPREVGVRSIGHFGFFQERCRGPLWDETAEWLAKA